MKHINTKAFGRFLSKNSPEILTGTGIALMITGVGLAIYDTFKYDERIRKENRKRMHNQEPELTTKEKAKIGVAYYIPTTVATLGAAACFIASDKVHAKRNAALATICGASETALQVYKDKIVEFFGEEKENEISDSIVKEQAIAAAKDIPVVPELEEPSDGDSNEKHWFYDPRTTKWIRSDKLTIEHCILDLKNLVTDQQFASLSDWYDILNQDYPEGSDLVGWNSINGTNSKWYPSISLVPWFKDDVPEYAIKYNHPPMYGFDSYNTY